MPTLNWIGKDKVIKPPPGCAFRVLDLQYTFSTGHQGEPNAESENKIIRGDNLEALKALLPQYEGKIKCIYIDPPYNTGNEGWVYNDNVNDPKFRKWLGQVVGKEGEDLSRHDKWLCMMYPRLKLPSVLAPDGAIFISIDDNEQANLKLICDESSAQPVSFPISHGREPIPPETIPKGSSTKWNICWFTASNPTGTQISCRVPKRWTQNIKIQIMIPRCGEPTMPLPLARPPIKAWFTQYNTLLLGKCFTQAMAPVGDTNRMICWTLCVAGVAMNCVICMMNGNVRTSVAYQKMKFVRM